MLALGIFILVAAGSAAAKPVPSTSLAEAHEKASAILIVEIIGHEFDDLAPGQSAETEDRWSLEMRYRVVKVLRDRAGKSPAGAKLELRLKSNGCVIIRENVTHAAHTLTFRRDGTPPQEDTVTIPVGAKQILLLDETGGHYGWSVSPQNYTPELEERLAKPTTGTK